MGGNVVVGDLPCMVQRCVAKILAGCNINYVRF